MSKNFHETYSDHGDIKLPSERSTGLVFAAVAAIVAVIFRDNLTVLTVALTTSLGFATVSFLQPSWLKQLNIAWFKFSLLLSRVMNPVIMFILFAVVIVPAGLIMNLLRDPLRKKRASKEEKTYWVERDFAADAAGSMKNQF